MQISITAKTSQPRFFLKRPTSTDLSHIHLGTDLVQRLETEAVLTPPGQQTCALNIVRSWDPYITSTIILIPVVLSFIVSVLWSVIAAAYFKADVNASTQTAFTIGSYVVTAGKSFQCKVNREKYANATRARYSSPWWHSSRASMSPMTEFPTSSQPLITTRYNKRSPIPHVSRRN